MPINIKKRTAPKDESHFFEYGTLARNMWFDLFGEAHDHFNIYFDHENDDDIPPGRIFTFEVPRPEENIYPLTYQFKCKLHAAGGDWEEPCYYFRCQITEGSFYDFGRYPGSLGPYKRSFFIVIPGISDGNTRLVEKEDGKGLMAMDNSHGEDSPELDEKKAWQFIEEYLKKMVEDYTTQVEAKRLADKTKRTAMAKNVLMNMFIKNRSDYGI